MVNMLSDLLPKSEPDRTEGGKDRERTVAHRRKRRIWEMVQFDAETARGTVAVI